MERSFKLGIRQISVPKETKKVGRSVPRPPQIVCLIFRRAEDSASYFPTISTF